MRLSPLLASALLSATSVISAQAPAGARPTPPPPGPGEVRGTVVDAASRSPVARASVAIRSKRDSSLVTGAIAAANGSFRIQGLRPGAYYVRVTAIGFSPKLQDFTITPAAPEVNLGAIGLTAVAVELSGITVTEERGPVAIEPDRNSYKSKDVAPAATNASEVLDAVPAVQVDHDGKVSLRGNENVAVQINGRPAPMRGAQLGAFLKTLPANVLDRIEVIPNPSAKYDPEGMAGIINIVLKENTDLGMSAGLTAGYSRVDRYNLSGTFGYQEGKVTSFSNLGMNMDTRDIVGINDRERYDALRALVSVTEQDIRSEVANSGIRFNSTLDYRVNNRDLWSNAVTVNRRRSGEDARNVYAELNSSRSTTDAYLRPRDNDMNGLVIDYTTAWKRTITPRRHELNTELRLTRTHDDEVSSIWRQPLTTTSQIERQRDETDALTYQLNAQLDYMRPLGTRAKLEVGYKGTGRWLDRQFLVTKDSLGSGSWVVSPLSNDFEFDELVNAVYGVVSRSVGKRVELQGGLRGERASRDFMLASGSYPYSKYSLFPSAVALFNKSAQTQLKASYSRRVRRPGTQELNPFPSFFDVHNVFLGNPSLNPEYTDAFELGYTRNMKLGMVQVSPFYRRTTDIIRVDINTADTLDGREVTTVSFRNLATSNSWGADLNGQLRLGPKLNGFAGFNVFKMVTDGGSTTAVGSDAVTWMGRVNATTQLAKNTTLQGSYFYRAPMKIERGQFQRQHMANFSLRQKLNGDKAVMTLRVSDPFNTGAFRIRAGDDNVMQITERNFGSRMAFLTFQWNYGQTPRVREPRQDQQPEPQTRFP